MADKKLFDNLYKVLKVNSGDFGVNDQVMTECLDLQIPRGYCARIRKVIFTDYLCGQASQTSPEFRGALIMDPDDETSIAIPTFVIDHDVLCDFEHYYFGFERDVTPNGISFVHNQRTRYVFSEEIDVVTVRNIRFNSICHGLDVTGCKCQNKCTVFFTYEKITADLYAMLLGIS
ncbi:hypothetical protein ES703_95179 [subsurface metagenome]